MSEFKWLFADSLSVEHIRRRLAILPLLIALSALVGCSMYPIPDDVTPLKTEEIVRHGRCEMRAAIIDRIAQGKKSLTEILGTPTGEIKGRVDKWMEDHHITDATLSQGQSYCRIGYSDKCDREAPTEKK